MELTSFKIQNFRSITNSGNVELSHITALLGRNESGKSNLLLGLQTLNPPDGIKELFPTKNFPRHRKSSECSNKTVVVSSLWRFTDDEQAELEEILPRAHGVLQVEIGRYYEAIRWVTLQDLPELEVDKKAIQNTIAKIKASVKAASENIEDTHKAPLKAAADIFANAISIKGNEKEWAVLAKAALDELRQAIATANAALPENQENDILSLEEFCQSFIDDEENHKAARRWVISKLPVFLYFAEYPELQGHQNISSYIQRKSQNLLTTADKDFEKLCKVADLDPATLHNRQ